MNNESALQIFFRHFVTMAAVFLLSCTGLFSYYQNKLTFLAPGFRHLVMLGSLILMLIVIVNMIDIILILSRQTIYNYTTIDIYNCDTLGSHIYCQHYLLYPTDFNQSYHIVYTYWPAKILIIFFPVGLYFLGMPNDIFTKRRQLEMVGNQYSLGFSLDYDDLVKDAEIVEEYMADDGQLIRILRTNIGLKIKQLVNSNGIAIYSSLENNQAVEMRFSDINDASYDSRKREILNGTTIIVEGRLKKITDKEFTLFRLKMTCCAADTVALKLRIKSPQALIGLSDFDWVRVKGQLTFIQVDRSDTYLPVIFLSDLTDIVKTVVKNEYEI